MKANFKKNKGIDLDELQQEIEKLLSLLKHREPGLFTWNEWIRRRLENLRELTSRALGK